MIMMSHGIPGVRGHMHRDINVPHVHAQISYCTSFVERLPMSQMKPISLFIGYIIISSLLSRFYKFMWVRDSLV